MAGHTPGLTDQEAATAAAIKRALETPVALIDAAPDLLAACKAYLNRQTLDEAEAAYRQMEAAVARAEGEKV